MTKRTQLTHEALSWVDTPWHHRACVKGVGVDCVRLLEGIAKACGLLDTAWQPPFYTEQWHLHQQAEMLLGVLTELGATEIPLAQRQPGDLVLCQYGHVSSHAGILVRRAPDYLIHARRDQGKVVHQGLQGDLLTRLRHIYVLPGVDG